jgi:hypothetical protein
MPFSSVVLPYLNGRTQVKQKVGGAVAGWKVRAGGEWGGVTSCQSVSRVAGRSGLARLAPLAALLDGARSGTKGHEKSPVPKVAKAVEVGHLTPGQYTAAEPVGPGMAFWGGLLSGGRSVSRRGGCPSGRETNVARSRRG